MLNRKPIIEDHRKAAEARLAVRLELLKAKGLDDKAIQKDAKIKQYRAQVRKAKHQIAAIAAMAALTSEKADTKARKEAAAKEAPHREPKKAPKSTAPKKPKKERKAVAQESE